MQTSPVSFGTSIPLRFSGHPVRFGADDPDASTQSEPVAATESDAGPDKKTQQKRKRRGGEPNAIVRGLRVLRNGVLTLAGLLMLGIGADQYFTGGEIRDDILPKYSSGAPVDNRDFRPTTDTYHLDDKGSKDGGVHIHIGENSRDINIDLDGSGQRSLQDAGIDVEGVQRALDNYRDELRSRFDEFTTRSRVKSIVVPQQIIVHSPQEQIIVRPQERVIVQDSKTIVIERPDRTRRILENVFAYGLMRAIDRAFIGDHFHGYPGPFHFHSPYHW